MSNFLELLEQEEDKLYEQDDELVEFMVNEADEEDLRVIKEESGLSDDEFGELMEAFKKRVSSTGKVKKVRDRKTRSRRSRMTTGMSKSALKRRAKKSARTKKKNPSIARKANKRRKKANRKRKNMGIK